MNMNDFLKIRTIKEYKENDEKEMITIGINPNYITNFNINNDMIIIHTRTKNPVTLSSEYRIFKENLEKKEVSNYIELLGRSNCYVEEIEFFRLQELLK
jgi:hypothetical protein